MPECNGYRASELILKFLSEKENAVDEIPMPFICLLTSYNKPSKEEADKYGINLRVSKPIFKEGLRKILEKAGILSYD